MLVDLPSPPTWPLESSINIWNLLLTDINLVPPMLGEDKPLVALKFWFENLITSHEQTLFSPVSYWECHFSLAQVYFAFLFICHQYLSLTSKCCCPGKCGIPPGNVQFLLHSATKYSITYIVAWPLTNYSLHYPLIVYSCRPFEAGIPPDPPRRLSPSAPVGMSTSKVIDSTVF